MRQYACIDSLDSLLWGLTCLSVLTEYIECVENPIREEQIQLECYAWKIEWSSVKYGVKVKVLLLLTFSQHFECDQFQIADNLTLFYFAWINSIYSSINTSLPIKKAFFVLTSFQIFSSPCFHFCIV